MKQTGREGLIIGILIVLHMLGSGLVNFAMEASLFDGPGFLINAAPNSQRIGLAVLMGIATDVLPLGIAITAFPVFYARSQRMAIWFVSLTAVALAIAVVENIGVMSMVSMSQAYLNASPLGREQLETSRVIVASARNWPHFISRILVGSGLLNFFAVLYRFALVPRALAAFGVLAALLMITALSFALFDRDVIFLMLAPMGLSQLILAIWLIVKGFRDQLDQKNGATG